MTKKGISISSLLGPKESDGNEEDDDLVPITRAEVDMARMKSLMNNEEVITIDDDDDDLPDLLSKEEIHPPAQLKRTLSGKVDINSMLSSNEIDSNKQPEENNVTQEANGKQQDKKEEEKPAPKRRKPRAVKKKEEPEVEKPKPKQKRAPRVTKKQKEAAAVAESKGKKEVEEAAAAEAKKKEDDQKVAVTNNEVPTTMNTNIVQPIQPVPIINPPTSLQPQLNIQPSSLNQNSTPQTNHLVPLTTPTGFTPVVKSPLNFSAKPNDINNLLHADDSVMKKPQLLPSLLSNDSLKPITIVPTVPTLPSIPTTTTTSTTTTPKPKKNQKKTVDKELKPKGKPGPKKGDSKKSSTPQQSIEPIIPLTQDQINNQKLIKPDQKLTESLPPPKVIEIKQSQSQVSSSPKQLPQSPSQESTPQPDGKPTEPIIALHVPLTHPTSLQGTGATQVVFNVLKMAEDKYGWKNMHPEASKYSLELMQDEDIEDDDDEDDDEKDEKEEKEEEEHPQRIDGRRLQKGKPKIGQYDKEDPFIDDSEMVWEEQRASTKDGFFVFYGPLVEEGKSAKIERADGTIKRSRKRVVGQSGNTGAPTAKKRNVNGSNSASKQSTPNILSIAPASGVPIDIAPKV